MSQQDEIKRLAQQIADILSGNATERFREARLYLEGNLEAVLSILVALARIVAVAASASSAIGYPYISCQ